SVQTITDFGASLDEGGSIKVDMDKSRREITDFHSKIYGEQKEDGTREEGYDQKLNGLVSGFEKKGEELDNKSAELDKKIAELKNEKEETFHSIEQEKKNAFHSIEKEKNEQMDKVKSLLPMAAAKGLSWKYDSCKKDYKKDERFWLWILGAAVLLGPALVCFPLFFDLKGWELHIYRISIAGLVAYAINFAGGRLRESRRLGEEYGHKEAAACTYVGFRAKIEGEERDDDLVKKLQNTLVDVVARNPAETMTLQKESPKTKLSKDDPPN
ncbi:MAG: hypothetical protein OXB93_02020, partial [Cytophagales bacterium]|nr:hypothetical protein [Cytophagales bacterium]